MNGGSARRGISPRLAAAGAVLALSALVASSAAADVFKPTRFGDPPPDGCKLADCSLREAVIRVNRHAGPDTIRLSKGTYLLKIPEAPADPNNSKFGDLDLNGQTRIIGAGAGQSVVSANGLGRAFHLMGTSVPYTLQDLAIRDGSANGPGTSGSGGGVLAGNPGGSLTLADVVVKQNHSSQSGGGVYSVAAGLTITRSTISGNDSTIAGGGVALGAGSGPVAGSLDASTVSGNTAYIGAGVAADGSDPGGFPNPPTLALLNSTIAGNNVSGNGVGGGASAVNGGTVTLDNSTVAYNSAPLGGGIYHSATGAFQLGDALIAQNTATTNGSQCSGVFTGLNGNVIEFQTGISCSISGTITEPANAHIGPLQNNGGPTNTIFLYSNSPAIEYAESCPATDQRGVTRPAVDCDSGAFETDLLPNP